MKTEGELRTHLRCGLLPTSLSPCADKETSRLASKLLLLPKLPSGVKEGLHLGGHGPVPCGEPEQDTIRCCQL